VLTLERLQNVDYTKTVRVDQGSEFGSGDLDIRAYLKNVVLDFSRPGQADGHPAASKCFGGCQRAACSKPSELAASFRTIAAPPATYLGRVL
jgi:hypothetical protein